MTRACNRRAWWRSQLVSCRCSKRKADRRHGIYRQEVRPFTDKQIALVQNFAAQAVIAIENTRLLNELRESLQQQTATSDVLECHHSSPGELEPVFQAMLANATRICEAKFGNCPFAKATTFARRLARRAAGIRRITAANARSSGVQVRAWPRRADERGRPYWDDAADPAYSSAIRAVPRWTRRRSHLLSVPMLKDDEVIGAIAIYRQEVRPFTDKQIALVQNFAAQAVIAIENTRLLNELRQRTDDLTIGTADRHLRRAESHQSLDIRSSDRADTLVELAARLCEADYVVQFRRKAARSICRQLWLSPQFNEFDGGQSIPAAEALLPVGRHSR